MSANANDAYALEIGHVGWPDSLQYAQFCDEAAEEFRGFLRTLNQKYPWFSLETPRTSMHNVEIFLIYIFVKRIKPDYIFESGTARGRVTIVIAEACRNILPRTRIVSSSYPNLKDNVEEFMKDFDNLTVRVGEGGQNTIDHVPAGGKIVCIIDGPKPSLHGDAWNELMTKILRRDDADAIFHHDCRRFYRPGHLAKALEYFSEGMYRRFMWGEMTRDFLGRWTPRLFPASEYTDAPTDINWMAANRIPNLVYQVRNAMDVEQFRSIRSRMMAAEGV